MLIGATGSGHEVRDPRRSALKFRRPLCIGSAETTECTQRVLIFLLSLQDRESLGCRLEGLPMLLTEWVRV